MILEEMGADVLDINEIVYELEVEFDIYISSADEEQLSTVGDIITLVETRQKMSVA